MRWWTAQSEAVKCLNDDEIRNIRYAMRVSWQERVVQSIETQSTGGSPSGSSEHGICFTIPERTSGCKSLVERTVYNGLHCVSVVVNEKAVAGFTLHWLEVPVLIPNDDNTVNFSALASRFQPKFPVGLRLDCFPYVLEEGLHSARPYLWLGEPVPSFGPDTERATKTGTVWGTDRWGRNRPAQGGHQAYRTDAVCPAAEVKFSHEAPQESECGHGQQDSLGYKT
ncbi:hypothetical protein TSTA_087460 [Talaromyces stipitatus ATCC 10500]|uniref:Uncharacterized protein n=1 Tax=Talaromyces stipitatus (strain ATCC 10500 / CBS 375.48 / QM 6759 / NRRL 1006) TaxID=441959 RepID=B8M246_TALSN|nr:uncharacterized protein TSTA_087460 [Talaromyces stipitatus ATCC 10500]EED21510.1 hypothetical protein TSTA_087460 [Talaromyces stipitatus ATCC 10500]